MSIDEIGSYITVVISFGLFIWDIKNRKCQEVVEITSLVFFRGFMASALLNIYTIVQSISQKMSMVVIIMYILYASLFIFVKTKREEKANEQRTEE